MSVRARGFRVGSLPNERSFPRTIGPGEEFTLNLGLDITDCDVAQTEQAPVVFEVERWWGTTTVAAGLEVDFDAWQGSLIAMMCEP